MTTLAELDPQLSFESLLSEATRVFNNRRNIVCGFSDPAPREAKPADETGRARG